MNEQNLKAQLLFQLHHGGLVAMFSGPVDTNSRLAMVVFKILFSFPPYFFLFSLSSFLLHLLFILFFLYLSFFHFLLVIYQAFPYHCVYVNGCGEKHIYFFFLETTLH